MTGLYSCCHARHGSIHEGFWRIHTTTATSTQSRLDVGRKLALVCASVAAEHRGRDVLVLDLRKLTQMVDYFVIATGTSRRQLHTMADEIDRNLNLLGERKMGIEGYSDSRWVLLDYGNVVVHLFDDETRRYYDLENLWGDAERVEWNQA